MLEKIKEKWEEIIKVKTIAAKELETARAEKIIGNSLDAKVTIFAEGEEYKFLKENEELLKLVLIVSGMEILENKRKAEINAYKVGFKLLFIVIWLMAIGMFSRNVEWCAIFMLISVSLIYALVIFLSNYLLYRYEKGE